MEETLKIYTLLLEEDKRYVGKTRDVPNRIVEHMYGRGSAWTRKYKFVKLENILDPASPFDEDKVVKECMSKYGIDNVRGGSYVQDELDDEQIKFLQIEIWNATDCCTRCGNNNHFVTDCHAKKTVNGDLIEYVYACSTCNAEFSDVNKCTRHEKSCKKRHEKKCERCGRKSHRTYECHASVDIYGVVIDSDESDSE